MSETTVILDGLLRRLREGDEDARRDLIGRAYQRLEHLAHGQLRAFPRTGETGDVLHEVLIKMDRALRTICPDTVRGFFALASQHIRWVLLDLAKKRMPDVEPGDKIDDEIGPATVAQKADLNAHLHKAVESLPDHQREVVDLLYYQGLKIAEAAIVLVVSDRTVKKRWREARLALHAALGGDASGIPHGGSQEPRSGP